MQSSPANAKPLNLYLYAYHIVYPSYFHPIEPIWAQRVGSDGLC